MVLGKKEFIGGFVLVFVVSVCILFYLHFYREEIYFQVIFDSNGGSEVAGQNVLIGGFANIPSQTMKNGYIFDGWYLGDEKFDFATKIRKDITLVARWISVSDASISKDNSSINQEQSPQKEISPSQSDTSNVTPSKPVEQVPSPSQPEPTPDDSPSPSAEASVTYQAILVDIPSSSVGQCYVYIKNSLGEYVSGYVDVIYINGASEHLYVSSGGVIKVRSTISSVNLASVD